MSQVSRAARCLQGAGIAAACLAGGAGGRYAYLCDGSVICGRRHCHDAADERDLTLDPVRADTQEAMRVAHFVSVVVVAGAIAAVSRPVLAQSLGDVAKQEEERRKDVKPSPKVYTNKDLSAPRSLADPGDASKPSAEQAQVPAAEKGKDAAKDAAKEDSAPKDQKYWSSRKKELEAKLERDKVLADGMQSRINALTADFSARSDPAQRAVIEGDRKRALAELETLKKGIKDDQKAIADFEEEARKASVPPGWLR
ncbi:MAG TPA: hypothetical protein VFP91_22105 [Vicinamibacterales bacterium]|nr:hypothetical protein [Vicinamibacterales bacterium]